MCILHITGGLCSPVPQLNHPGECIIEPLLGIRSMVPHNERERERERESWPLHDLDSYDVMTWLRAPDSWSCCSPGHHLGRPQPAPWWEGGGCRLGRLCSPALPTAVKTGSSRAFISCLSFNRTICNCWVETTMRPSDVFVKRTTSF